jgi:hypothetical protein
MKKILNLMIFGVLFCSIVFGCDSNNRDRRDSYRQRDRHPEVSEPTQGPTIEPTPEPTEIPTPSIDQESATIVVNSSVTINFRYHDFENDNDDDALKYNTIECSKCGGGDATTEEMLRFTRGLLIINPKYAGRIKTSQSPR